MKLQRTQLGASAPATPTLGTLTSRDGAFTCVTLERPVDGPHPCILAGTYHVKEDWHHPSSPDRYRCPELQDVPGRDQIQIHVANTLEQLLGCIAPGEQVSEDGRAVEASRAAFVRLMDFLRAQGVTEWQLEVCDPA